MELPRQESWSDFKFPSEDLSDPGIEPMSELAGGLFTTKPTGKHSTVVVVVVWSLSHVRLLQPHPWTIACQAPRSWDSPGKNTGVGCHFLFQYNTVIKTK